MTDAAFNSRFRALTGSEPMSWQTRMFSEHFEDGDCSNLKLIDLPTGLGKTMVMALWLIGREYNSALPRRLIYVVDRRTVVDQATDLAEDFAYLLSANPDQNLLHVAKRNPELIKRRRGNGVAFSSMREKLGGDLLVSTLRGQLADNRRWSQDPTKTAIIVGTVDLIGSALLFSGYRSSYKRRPLEAGLLGQDSLLVLDEAHLSKPFDKLLGSVETFQRNGLSSELPVNSMRVIRMSATSSRDTEEFVFGLKIVPNSDRRLFDLWSELDENGCEKNQIKTRYEAKKSLNVIAISEKDKRVDKIADEAITLAKSEAVKGRRIVVFVRKPNDAIDIAEKIRSRDKPSKSNTDPDPKGPYTDSVAVLTGTMRGFERDELVAQPVMQRFMDSDEKPGDNNAPVFLVSTSAGEVGFDLNADHMVCDAATIDSFIQRLGRVNRRGHGQAHIKLVLERPKTDKKTGKPIELKGIDRAISNAIALLPDGMSLSPQNIAKLRSEDWKDKYTDACSPPVPTVELTDILLDNWSMTSITERMPGRPEVAPWLRGVDVEQSQTTIAWRAELDLPFTGVESEKALAAIFAKHRIRAHESLTVNTRYLIDEFLKKLPNPKAGEVNLRSTRCAIRLPRGQVLCRTIEQLIDLPDLLYVDTTLILPASFGGLNCGMLDAGSVSHGQDNETAVAQSLDIADHPGYEANRTLQNRLRVLLKRDPNNDEWRIVPFPAKASLPDSIDLDARKSKTTPLVAKLRAAGFRVQRIQPIRREDDGELVESLACLAPTVAGNRSKDQSLYDHVYAVESHVKRISDNLQLSVDHPVRIAAEFAAKWHDEGKKAVVWQRFANNLGPESGIPLGKMAQARDPKSLRGYRHEFGSLLRLQYPERQVTSSTLPDNPDVRDLALHLIAIHHGAGRPHFDTAVYDPFTDDEVDNVHTETIRRFAILQRKYGWWQLSWLENLMRCADALASAEVGSEVDEDETSEEGGE